MTGNCHRSAVLGLGLVISLLATTVTVKAGGAANAATETGLPCSETWYHAIEDRIPTGDGRGHGPDVGSQEWQSVVEFKLGIRGSVNLPERDSEAWCNYIDRLAWNNETGHGTKTDSKRVGRAMGPSFTCDAVEAGSIEAMICDDEELSALDRKLAGVYTAASEIAMNEPPSRLKAEQRGWIKGRNECWKEHDERECVRGEYERRIAELQAGYRLVPGVGPARFTCDDNSANQVDVMFFRTSPPTLIAERGDSVSAMYLQPVASGSRYQGGNATFWEHQGEAMITWGYGTAQMHCVRVQ